MRISNNNVVVNNTYKFVFPILRLYGKEYVKHISMLYKQGVFIDNLKCFHKGDSDYLHIVINVPLTVEKQGYSKLVDTIVWFRKQKYLEKDYILNVNRRNKSPVHIVLMIEIPSKYKKCVDRFIVGNTNMFTKNDIDKCFTDFGSGNSDFFSYCRNVLVKKRKIKIKFEDEILDY